MDQTTGTNLIDQRLVKRVLQGETHVFSEIIKRTENLVAQIVFKMIDNQEDRNDLSQDIYLKVFHNLAGFRFESKLSTWIAQIAYHTCFNYLQKKQLVLPGDGEPGSEEEALEKLMSKASPGHAQDAVDQMSQKERLAILQSAIERLSPVFKTLIILYHQESLSYGEIAQITNLPDGTVKSYLFRARKALRESILKKYKMEEL